MLWWSALVGLYPVLVAILLAIVRPAPLHAVWGDELWGFPFPYAMTQGDVRGPDGRPDVIWHPEGLVLDLAAAFLTWLLLALGIAWLRYGREEWEARRRARLVGAGQAPSKIGGNG